MSTPQRIETTTLANGLRVVHTAMPDTAMVALCVAYDAGARDESPDHTGLAHLVEHCMFGPSRHVADYSATLAAAGAVDNAWTSNDFTVYYSVAPAHNAETLFYAESDRMLRPLFDPAVVDVQRRVVVEEFKQQCLSRPYGDIMHHLRPMLYGSHPYSWPVIGKTIDQVEGLTRDLLVDWQERLYTPSSAVLSIAGNISAERAFALAERWFGSIPARPRVPRALAPVPQLSAPASLTIERPVPATMVTRAWLMDPYGTPGYFAADALTDVLAAGNSSRFYRNLIMADGGTTFAQADASISGAEHQGLLMVTARPAAETIDPRALADTMTAQLALIADQGITDRELQRAKNRQLTNHAMMRMSAPAVCQHNALATLRRTDPDFELNAYLALTPDDIRTQAARITAQHPATLTLRPISTPQAL